MISNLKGQTKGHRISAMPYDFEFHLDFIGGPGWIRTSGLPLRRRTLYPTELRDRAIWIVSLGSGIVKKMQKRPNYLSAVFCFESVIYES